MQLRGILREGAQAEIVRWAEGETGTVPKGTLKLGGNHSFELGAPP